MRGSIPPLPNTPSWRGAQLKKAEGQLNLYFTLSQSFVFYYTAWNLSGKENSWNIQEIIMWGRQQNMRRMLYWITDRRKVQRKGSKKQIKFVFLSNCDVRTCGS
jgi:hypothetical protein